MRRSEVLIAFFPAPPLPSITLARPRGSGLIQTLRARANNEGAPGARIVSQGIAQCAVLSASYFPYDFVSSNRCFLLVVEKVKFHRPRFTRISVNETENVEVLNAALFMTQNAAARVRPLRSRIGRSPWSFPSLNLSRSYNQQATVWRRIEILYASRSDRICLFRGNQNVRKRN